MVVSQASDTSHNPVFADREPPQPKITALLDLDSGHILRLGNHSQMVFRTRVYSIQFTTKATTSTGFRTNPAIEGTFFGPLSACLLIERGPRWTRRPRPHRLPSSHGYTAAFALNNLRIGGLARLARRTLSTMAFTGVNRGTPPPQRPANTSAI